MIVDNVFHIKGRGNCIVGCVPLNEELPQVGDILYSSINNFYIGTIRSIEMSLGNFGRRESIGIIVSSVTRPILPRKNEEVYWK